ncbi:MAG: two-component regulator propeller domain-containing protein [Pyrinomonadaceae bacterium]
MRAGLNVNVAGILCLSILALAASGFFSQSPVPVSPTPAANASPTGSPTPTRPPTPTPPPVAQNFHRWGSITVFNGLPSDSVRAIAQTRDGVMWFGTDNGLARFDGRRIQKFSFGSTEADRILVLRSAATGELWIGTGKGAFVYSGGGFQPVEGTQGVAVTCVLLGVDALLGTDSGEILRINANGRTFTSQPLISRPILSDAGTSLTISTIVEHDGNIIAGTPGGGAFSIKDGTVSEFSTSPRPLFINSLARGTAERLWLGTDARKGQSGVYLVDGGSKAVRITAPTANVLALEANDSGLWAGTERYGLFHFAEDKLTKAYTFENTSGGLRSDTIFTLFTDREGVIWIGTNRGVSRFDRAGPFHEHISDIPNSDFIRTIYQVPDSETVYAGSNRGLFTRRGDRWVEIPAFRNKVIYAIRKRYQASIVVGTTDGLFEIGGRKLFTGEVRGLAGSNDRTFAAVFGRGVVDITGDTPRTVFADVTANCVFGEADKLWIGTSEHGLFSYDGTAVRSEATHEALRSGTIWSVFRDGADSPLYLAGQHGVFAFQDGKAEQIIAAEEVRDVVSRDGQIWAATTTRGLLHARRDERFGWLVSAIGFEQGLPSEKAFSILPTEDGLMIATNRGIVTYKAGEVKPKLITTRILSQRVHDPQEAASTIALEHPQNSILIEVAGQSSRTFPEEFQYAFLLKNPKGEVIDSRVSNEPQYAPADLKPGEYAIEVIAYNRDLLASEMLTIGFSVAKAPFPWTATALGILLAIALVALIWAVVERRRIVERNRQLAAARFDLANEAERERSRIARDLHDQTLADLRGLMMKSDRLVPGNTEFRAEIESVSTEIRRICEDLSPSVLENVGLVPALEFLMTRSTKEHSFTAGKDANERVQFPLIAQLHIYRIAQEILSNIDRHSSATRVEMSVEVDNDCFVLKIRDDGEPFQPTGSAGNGRGIANIRSRASLVHADISWRKGPDGGNLFSMEIAGNGQLLSFPG